MKEKVGSFPNLNKEFDWLDRKIRSSRAEEREKLEKQKEILLQTVEGLGIKDIQMIFYAKEISQRYRVLPLLRRLYQTECAYKNFAHGSDEYQDPFSNNDHT